MKLTPRLRAKRDQHATGKPVSLKSIALHLGLSTTTISAVLNDSLTARSIPQATKDRVMKAVAELKYRPNFAARSLRQKRSFTIAVVVPEVSEGYSASVLGGIEERLIQDEYLYFVASHHGNQKLLVETYPRLLRERAVEGYIFLNTPPYPDIDVPVVTISERTESASVTNIVLDNTTAVRLALEHLTSLCHTKIAFFKGHPGSADTEPRWNAIRSISEKMRIKIDPALAIQLRGCAGEHEPSTLGEGYLYAQKLLKTGKPFTALFAFNDISAIGAISAFRDAGLRVPEDISVVGFDDIQAAAFQNPRLTTVRQPLHRMGELGAATLLERITNPEFRPRIILVDPELIVRESTAVAGRPRSAAC